MRVDTFGNSVTSFVTSCVVGVGEWTIYDASKNQSGRWCSMTVCGTPHNARAYRQRHRAERPSPLRPSEWTS